MNAMLSGELFAGVGGLGMAVDAVFGTTPGWFCEFDAAPSKVLAHHHPDVPNYGDVTKVDFTAAPHTVVRAGGFPCQDVSLAGRRKGMKGGTRSGLWSEFARSIEEDRPEWVVIENVRGLLSADAAGDVEQCAWCMGDGSGERALRALGAVLGDLADLGFDAEWRGLHASDVGAPHGRFRVFILAWPSERTIPWSPSEWVRPDVLPAIQPAEALLRTPMADEDGGGPLHPDIAKERGQTLRLTGQIPALTGDLLPATTAMDSESSGGSSASNVTLTDAVVRTGLGAVDNPRHLLPTPGAYDGDRGGSQHPDKRRAGNHSVTLQDVAEHMPLCGTPRAAQGAQGDLRDPNVIGNPRGRLEDQIALMPPPTVGNATGGNARRGGVRGDEVLLPGLAVEVAEGKPLPTLRATRGGSATEIAYGLGGYRTDTDRTQGEVVLGAEWGPYAPAIRRWEAVIGRPAPSSVRHDGRGGKARLNPGLTEWMMGWPAGHVTDPDIGMTRSEQLKACGNGVVPLQAVVALRMMLARAGVPAISWLKAVAA